MHHLNMEFSPIRFDDIDENLKIQVGHLTVPLSLVFRELQHRVTDSRWQRIQSVVENRCFNIQSVFENIYDLGNMSAAMRSAEAFGFYNFHVIDQPSGQFKAANRISLGSEKWLQIKRHKNAKQCVEDLKGQGFKIYATHLDASTPFSQIDFSEPSAVVFGNEKDGVSKEMMDLVDNNVVIPLYGFTQSLNLSVAAAIGFYMIHTQRTQKLGKSADLNNQQKLELYAKYLVNSFPRPEVYFKRYLK